MTYEYEEFGNGVAVPRVRMDLSGANGPRTGRRIRDRIFEIVDREGALLFRGAGIDGPRGYAGFLAAIGFRHHSYVGGTAPRTDLGRGVYTADRPAPRHDRDDPPGDELPGRCARLRLLLLPRAARERPADEPDRRHAPAVRGAAG